MDEEEFKWGVTLEDLNLDKLINKRYVKQKSLRDMIMADIIREQEKRLKALTEEIEDLTYDKTPVWTGALKRSWFTTQKDYSYKNGSKFSFETNDRGEKTWYAQRVLGDKGSKTLPRGMVPWLIRWVSQKGIKFKWEIKY